MNYLSVNIYSSDNRNDNVIYFVPVTDGNWDEMEVGEMVNNGKAVVLTLQKRVIGGNVYLNFKKQEDTRPMFGGSFVWSTDSRFRNEISEQPVALHDRVEGG